MHFAKMVLVVGVTLMLRETLEYVRIPMIGYRQEKLLRDLMNGWEQRRLMMELNLENQILMEAQRLS